MSSSPVSYLSGFQAVAQSAANHFELVGHFMIVEKLPEEEFRSKGGIILADTSRTQVNGLTSDRPTFARVLLVGAGAPDESGQLVKYDVEPGDIVLLPGTAIKPFSVFGKLVAAGATNLGLAVATDIQLRFKQEAGFNEFFRVLNEASASKVAS